MYIIKHQVIIFFTYWTNPSPNFLKQFFKSFAIFFSLNSLCLLITLYLVFLTIFVDTIRSSIVFFILTFYIYIIFNFFNWHYIDSDFFTFHGLFTYVLKQSSFGFIWTITVITLINLLSSLCFILCLFMFFVCLYAP